MRKILVITDMDSGGSGYRNICTPLLTELSKLDYEIKVIGFSNRGEEHSHPFSILPVTMLEEAVVMAGNLCALWNPDVVLVAMDLPIQIRLHASLQSYLKREGGDRKYIAITPLENGPLCLSWAAPLFPMDAVFFISELGKQEALKVGVKADHLQIGVDTVSWRPAYPEEKKQLRDGLGIPQDAFVILTVADNQERKNLWAAMEAISLLKKDGLPIPIRYVLVTREDTPVGWKLRDLAVSLGINAEYMPFNRGMPQRDLWGLYAASDVYLQTSKAEGLGLPVLDAMCMKIPVVATDTGALHELLEEGRGHLISGYKFGERNGFIDVWGNSSRVMVNIEDLSTALWTRAMVQTSYKMEELAYEWVTKRTWDIPAHQIHNKIEELFNEPKK